MTSSTEVKQPAPASSAVSPSDRATNDRVVEALAEYHRAVDSGHTPSRSGFLQLYPEIAEELAGYLDGFEFVRQVAPQLRGLEIDANGKTVLVARATLGDFQIVRELGRGGMGVVYEAEQLSLGRYVALKVLPFAAMLDKQQLTRFKNEARAAATLDHPNIVAIYSVGCERGVHFYAMQLVEGQTLAEIIAESRTEDASPKLAANPSADLDHKAPASDTARAALSTVRTTSGEARFKSIANLGIQAAEALEYAHRNGIVHRDIKPGNLMVDDSGKLSVTDFGLARIEADACVTLTGDVMGTLRYMSPEQAMGKRGGVDYRSDIYSLGVTLYELLTLRPVHTGEDRQELLRQIALDEPIAPRQVNPRIPRDLETIILKAVEKSSADRYASAQALADDLHCYLAHKSITAKPSTHFQKANKWVRRHPSVIWSASAVVIVGAVLSMASSFLLAEAYSTESSARRFAESEQAKAELQRRRAEQALGRMQFESGVRMMNQGNELGLLQLLDASALSEDVPDQREAIRRFWAIGHGLRRHTLTYVLGGDSAGPAYSPDGNLLATANDAVVELWTASNGEAYGKPLPSGAGTDWVKFSPNGQQLATHSKSSGTRLWDAHSGSPIGPFLLHGTSDDQSSVLTTSPLRSAFSPDGKLLATVGVDGQARLWDAQSGEPSGEPFQFGPIALRTVAFSPDGNLLAVGATGGIVRIVNVANRKPQGAVFTIPPNGRVPSNADRVVFSPDGKLLAVHGYSNAAWLLDVQTGEPRVTFEPNSSFGWCQDLKFSPDGRLVATAYTDWTVQLWDVATGNMRSGPLRHGGRVRTLAFSPDGTLLASGAVDRKLRLWDTTTGEMIGVPLPHGYAVNGISFSPDGKFLAAGQDDTRVWEINDQPILQHQTPIERIGSTEGSLDGRYAATINKQYGVDLRDTATGKTISNQPLSNEPTTDIAFSPDGKFLATASENWEAKIWDVVAGRQLRSFFCHERVYGVAFNSAQDLLAAACYDGNVILWDVAAGRQHGLPIKHPAPVWEVAFSPDGNLMATAFGNDFTQLQVKLWNIAIDPPSLGLVLPFTVSKDRGAFDAFSLTGKLQLGVNGDQEYVGWQLPEPPQDVSEMRLKTLVALGFRRDLSGEPIVVPAAEWRELRDQLHAMEQTVADDTQAGEPNLKLLRRRTSQNEVPGEAASQ